MKRQLALMIMDVTCGDSDARYGFLSVLEIDRLGYCGGLLVLSRIGRPLEFHCTSPVNPNRAQQILYGRSLRPFVLCDRIGATLVREVTDGLSVVLVDDADLQGLADLVDIPVVCVFRDAQPVTGQSMQLVELAGQRLGIGDRGGRDCEPLLREFLKQLPLTEPFERIHEAIGEAHAKAA